MPAGSSEHMPETPNVLSRKNSRRFLFGLIVVTLILAFLAALGIKSAAENDAFQEEVIEMRRMYDPNFKEPGSDAAPAPASSPDSTVSN